MKIALASDHGGYELKEHLKTWLESKGHRTEDFGSHSPESVDYPDFLYPAALSVAQGKCDVGILIPGAAYAGGWVANKVPGIRAAVCYDPKAASISREHGNSNILCLGGKEILKSTAEKICESWLNTEYAGGRHQNRLDKIERIEKRHMIDKLDLTGYHTGSYQHYDSTGVCKIVTEETVRWAAQQGMPLTVSAETVYTPSARDLIKELGITTRMI